MNSSCHIIRASVLFDFHQMGLTEMVTRDNDKEKKGASCCVPPTPSISSHPFPPAHQHLSIHPCLLTSNVNLGSCRWPTSHRSEISAGPNSQNVAVKCCDLIPRSKTRRRQAQQVVASATCRKCISPHRCHAPTDRNTQAHAYITVY